MITPSDLEHWEKGGNSAPTVSRSINGNLHTDTPILEASTEYSVDPPTLVMDTLWARRSPDHDQITNRLPESFTVNRIGATEMNST